MNTQETLEGLVKGFEERIKNDRNAQENDRTIIAYCLCVIARSLTR